MKTIIAIDPGTVESAVIGWDGSIISTMVKLPNEAVLGSIYSLCPDFILAIEMIASYGMAVGKEVFETCVWIGRYYEAWENRTHVKPQLVYRSDVKSFWCHSARAKDSNIRQALIDRFGPPGKKASPGLTYGLAGDMWQAFAIAAMVADQYPVQ